MAMLSWIGVGFLSGSVLTAWLVGGVIAGVAITLAATAAAIMVSPIDCIRKDMRQFAAEDLRGHVISAEVINEDTICVYTHDGGGEVTMVMCPRREPSNSWKVPVDAE